MSRIHGFIRGIAELDDRLTRLFNRNNLDALRNFAAKLPQIAQEFIETTKELDAAYSRINASLADRGWYLPGEISALDYLNLASAFQAGEDEKVERIVQEYARSRIVGLPKAVERRHPKRHAVISDAVEAHCSEKYTLSVPAFLTQVDGICRDVFDRFFFSSRGGKLSDKAKELVVGEHFRSLLTPLLEPRSLQVATETWTERRQADGLYGPLNRHGVLHGTELDYATEGNSLRAALLVEYLLGVEEILDRTTSSRKTEAQ